MRWIALALVLQARQGPGDGLKLELYDIQGVLAGVQDFPGPFDRAPAGGPGRLEVEHLLPVVRALVAPPGRCEFQNGLLVVRATVDEHQSVRGLLEVFWRRTSVLIAVTARVVSTTEGLDGRNAPHAARLSAADAAALLKRIEADGKSKVLSAPKLTVYNRQLSNILIGSQVSYIKSFEARIDGDTVVYDPVIATATTGQSIEVRPELKAWEKPEVRLDLGITLSERRTDTPREIETPHGKIQDPEIQTLETVLTPKLKEGETLLVGPLSRPWSRKDDPKLWLLLSLTVVKEK